MLVIAGNSWTKLAIFSFNWNFEEKNPVFLNFKGQRRALQLMLNILRQIMI